MESSAPVARPTPALLDPRRWWALALLCGAFFMVILDGTLTIVAPPSIGADFRFSEQGLQWVLSAYARTFGGLLLLGGARPTCSGAGASSWPVSCLSPPRRSCSLAGRGKRTSYWIQARRSAPGTEKTRPNAADQRHWQLTPSNERRSENGKDRRERKRHARWSRPGSGR